jgi:hypothetical protein
MINMRIVSRRVANNYKHKRCKTWTTKIKIITTKRVVNHCNQRGRRRKTTINMKTVNMIVASNHKHKRCKGGYKVR